MESRYRPMVRYADGRYRRSILKNTTIEETLQGLYEPVSDVWWASLRHQQRKRLLSLCKCTAPGVVVYARRPDPEHNWEDVWMDATNLHERFQLSTMTADGVSMRECCLCFVPVKDAVQWEESKYS